MGQTMTDDTYCLGYLPNNDNIRVLEQWDGIVLETVGVLSFKAHLVNMNSTESKPMLFDTSEVDPKNQHLIQRGARFVWTRQYRDTPSGRFHESFLEFTDENEKASP